MPGTCAVCHSSIGIAGYLRTPISIPGQIDHPVGLGTTVDCTACHSSAATTLDSVQFPSGVTVEGLGSSAVCSVCHQGRAATETVLNATQGMDEDTVIGDLQFINVHYAPSASTQLGTTVRGGFEYQDKVYKGRFDHVPNLKHLHKLPQPAFASGGYRELHNLSSGRPELCGDPHLSHRL